MIKRDNCGISPHSNDSPKVLHSLTFEEDILTENSVMAANRSSLLGVPTELRLQIYDYLLDPEIAYTALTGFHKESTSFNARPIFVNGYDASLHLPWIRLLQTCRTISDELRAHIRKRTTVCSKANEIAVPNSTKEVHGHEYTSGGTYVLAVRSNDGPNDIGEVTWRRVSCSPAQVRRLVVNIAFDVRMAWWGDGGPSAAPRSLYQLLNLFIHCGPRLDPIRPLEQHIRLDEMQIYLLVLDSGLGPRSWVGINLGGSVALQITKIMDRGILHGSVDKVYFRSSMPIDRRGRKELERSSEKCHEAAIIPHRWKGYGFEWGVPGACSLRAADEQHLGPLLAGEALNKNGRREFSR